MKEIRFGVNYAYIANDGTKFYDMGQCVDYENQKEYRKFKNKILMFTENGTKLSLCFNNMEDMTYLKILTNEAAEFVAETFKYYILPWSKKDKAKAGAWKYDDETETWTSKEELKTRMQFEIDFIS